MARLLSLNCTAREMTNHLSTGAVVPDRTVETIGGQTLRLPAISGRTHLQFRRFAGCPICNLHVRSFAQRHADIAEAGITEVVFFHSPANALRAYKESLPFAVVADPDRVHYGEFGVEAGVRALTHPRAWRAAMRGYADVITHRKDPALAGVGFGDGSTHFGLPADFLIDPDGSIVALHYGRHADDQWSVDQLLDIHRSPGRKEPC
jgi:peroxiredoxin